MFSRLLILNWRIFISSLNRFQLLLSAGYVLFLVFMLFNLVGTAVVVSMMDSDPWVQLQLPWLTDDLYTFILLVFANAYWVMHFSFTNLRLLNINENRKLLGFGFSLRRLSGYMMVIGFFHPVNIIYNLTWLVFLMLKADYLYQVPVGIMAIILNYTLIYSVKHRFIRIVEKKFMMVVGFFLLAVFALFQLITIFAVNSGAFFAELIPEIETVNSFLSWLPGGMLLHTTYTAYGLSTGIIALLFATVLAGMLLTDHYYKTREGLQNPSIRKAEEERGSLRTILHKILGPNAGKYYFYVMKHPYNRIQILTISIIPVVYVPLLLSVEYELARTILIPTILAGVPVALLAMGMANMYGYENREFLLHLQFPVKLEKQLKERFLGVITLPLLVFYLITIFELLFIPEIGKPLPIFISNTFFFLMFMLLFVWSSYFQYQKATYTSFSYKHPIIPQKVTFAISFMIFTMGYLVFVPLNGLGWYRLTIMLAVILVTVVYLWRHMEVLVNLFKKRVLMRLWNEL